MVHRALEIFIFLILFLCGLLSLSMNAPASPHQWEHFIEDRGDVLDPHSALKSLSGTFPEVYKTKYSNYDFWFLKEAQKDFVVIFIDSQAVEDVSVWQVKDGELIPVTSQLNTVSKSFSHTGQKGDKFLIKLRFFERNQAKIHFLTLSEFFQGDDAFLLAVMLIGILVGMGLHKGSMFFSSKQPILLFFSAYALSCAIIIACFMGLIDPIWGPALGILAIGCSAAFTIYYLRALEYARFAVYAIFLVMSFSVGLLIVNLVDNETKPLMDMLYCAVISLQLYLAVKGAWLKMMQAKVFLLSFVSASCGFFVTMLWIYDLVEASIFVVNSLSLGLTGQIVILALGAGFEIDALQKRLVGRMVGLNKELETKVAEKTRDMRAVLDALPQGIFTITEVDGKFKTSDHSLSLWSLMPIPNPSLNDVLNRTNLDKLERERIHTNVMLSLGDDIFQFKVNSHNLPRECKIDDKIIEIEWAPVEGSNHTVVKIICILRDVTELKALEAENALKRKATIIAQELIHSKTEALGPFFDTAYECLNEPFHDQSLMALHTIKGISMTLGLEDLSKSIHEAETELLEEKEKDSEGIRKKLLSKLNIYFGNYEKIFGSSNDFVMIKPEELKKIANESLDETTTRELTYFTDPNLEKSLGVEIEAMESLAEKLSKNKPDIVFVGDRVSLSKQIADLLKKVFIHLLRNSIDHGIELPLERKRIGKDPTGKIVFCVECSSQELKIRYADDGQGIKVPPEDVFRIFDDGFSTAERVTDVSGRGVGMGAVKSFLKAHGGEIHVLSTAHNEGYTNIAFEISIPIKLSEINECMQLAEIA